MAAWSNTNSAVVTRGFNNLRSRSTKYFAEREMGQLSASSYASDSGCVADFTVDNVVSAPAPVIVDVNSLPKVDLKSVLDRQPKYEVQNSASWNGSSPLANSVKVKWERS
jgi:hypothetical protein